LIRGKYISYYNVYNNHIIYAQGLLEGDVGRHEESRDGTAKAEPGTGGSAARPTKGLKETGQWERTNYVTKQGRAP
jgi:hypothetical protein